MAPRRVKVNKFDYKKLSANDVICPICRSILIKPVTLPCSHGFCASCFETTTQNANLVCPLCRVRVGSWLRSATKSKKMINETFWQAIQELFPLQVRNKLNGMNENFIEDKYNINRGNLNKRGNSTGIGENIRNMKQNEYQSALNINKLKTSKSGENKLADQVIPSTSASLLTKAAGFVDTISKNHNQTLSLNSEKNEKRSNLLNNFATKEYTCRILCQNVSSKDTQKQVTNESLTLIQRKNKRIQKITKAESIDDRSNSIESECLYFKPIDYRHNPPSEGLPPIKVPSRKPNISPNMKILAPCGQNQINMNYLESAFARLFSPLLSNNKNLETSKQEIIDSEQSTSQDVAVASLKRKFDNSDTKSKKKMKNNHKPIEDQIIEKKQDATGDLLCKCRDGNDENFQVSINSSNNNIKKSTNDKQIAKNLLSEESIKKSLQEKADFEFATKLQQKYNQAVKYSTRSSVLKRAAANKEVKIGTIMTPYKVK